MSYNRFNPYFRLGPGGRRVSFGRLLLTIAADSPQAQTVMSRLKTKVVRHLVLQILDIPRKKFDHLSAFGTDHMVVVLVVVMML